MKKLFAAMALTAGLAMPASASITIIDPVGSAPSGDNAFSGPGQFLNGLTFYTGSGLSVDTNGYFEFFFVAQESGFHNIFSASGWSGSAFYQENGPHSPATDYSAAPVAFGGKVYVSAGEIVDSAFSFTSPLGTFDLSTSQFAYFTTGASSGLDQLLFAFDDSGFEVDDNHDDMIILAKFTSAIPEPATWLMMIMGFGLVGLAARRRSAIATA